MSNTLSIEDKDDWPIQCSLDEQQCQQECEHKSNRKDCPFASELPYKKEFHKYFEKYYPHLIPKNNAQQTLHNKSPVRWVR